MKTRVFKYGPHKCKAYLKPAGKGYEVGFHFGAKPVFVGNFLHRKEANAWWTKMNTEFKAFTKKYGIAKSAPISFYTKFLSNHFYNTYYKYLDKQFTSYERTYNKAVVTDLKKYKKLKAQKGWTPSEKYKLRNAA